MITHRVIDLIEDCIVINGSLDECNFLAASQPERFFVEELSLTEAKFLNDYHLALKQGRNYLNIGNLNSF